MQEKLSNHSETFKNLSLENKSFNSSLLSCIEKIKIDWQKNNDLAVISQNWSKIVGEKLASNCSPLSLKKGVLIIGASHPQWRQALFYTRNQILDSLKTSGHKIKDLRIQQYHPKKIKSLETEQSIWEKHPSRLNINGLKICKYCQKPAPYGEIERWDKCSFCRRNDLSI
tara:strand:- start:410 stop:919 length:510 start_codon:yes stop_codon:yes gene_type:complete